VLVRGDLLPLFDDRAGIATAQVNQELMRLRSVRGSTFESNRRAQQYRSQGGPSRRRGRRAGARPVRSANVQRIERIDRPQVVELLARANLLPAIFFIFSRAGCEGAVQQVRRSGVRLTDRDERDEIRRSSTSAR
jgi:ATP-dependent RNA helicase HelY